MSATARTLMGTFGTTDYLVPMVLEDLGEEDARVRSRGDEGPSIAWIVGHLLHYRHHVMSLLGAERENPWETQFHTAEATDGRDYPSVPELRSAWERVAQDFAAVLTAQPEAEFDRPAQGVHEERTVRDQMVFFAWHEGYHMGALGAQLKRLGYLGPAEKVMAARRARVEP